MLFSLTHILSFRFTFSDASSKSRKLEQSGNGFRMTRYCRIVSARASKHGPSVCQFHQAYSAPAWLDCLSVQAASRTYKIK